MNFLSEPRTRFLAENSLRACHSMAALCAAVGFALTASSEAAIDFTYNSATEIPVSASSYNATGTATLALNFAPMTGTSLTLVNNTGLGFINGTFSNLAQGHEVSLSFSGISYRFVVNYFGGTGNDLVLDWANTKCLSWNGGVGQPNSLNTGILAGKTIVSVAATDHILMLCADGTLAAMGNNSYGQLGNGTKSSSSVPVLVSRNGALKGKTVIAIATGWSSSVALCSDGTIATWGQNFYFQLGNGTSTDSSLPVEIVRTGILSEKTVIGIAAGYWHVLALCSDGTVAAWGRGANGQLGDGIHANQNMPVLVNTTGILSGKTVTAIAAGQIHSLALCSDNTLVAWGNGDYRQLGTGQEGGAAYTPVAVNMSGVLAGKKILSIASGSYHNLVLCTDGSLMSWGFNRQGQVGNNSANSYIANPVFVDTSGTLAGKTIKTVSAGAFHSLASCTDGTLAYWGGLTAVERAPVPTQTAATSDGSVFIRTASASSSPVSVGFLSSPPPLPASIEASSGSGQQAVTNHAFAQPLRALVKDASNLPISGVPVTFAAPDSGASSLFGDNSSIIVITDANGIANSGIVTASGMNGTYIVTATASLVSTPASFALSNGTELPTPTMPPTPAGGFTASKQTGLFDITVSVRNTTPLPINGFRLHVDLSSYLSAYPSLRLYNASSPVGSPDVYVDYPYPVALDGVISMKLSFYTSTRTFPNPFAPSLSVEILEASQLTDTNGSGVQPRVIMMQDGAILIEFPSVPGHWYRVRYSSDMVMWSDCPVPLQAAGTRMQWIDSGPPFTNVPPSSVPSRFYVVNEILAP